jgi:hypothetical protein
MLRSYLPLFILAAQSLVSAQTAQVPQTARQALTEMLFSGSAESFSKHLPDATKAVLLDKAATGFGPANFAGDLKNPSKNFQTFPAGPVWISSEDKRTGDKLEINIDRDDLMGDRDEIDLSFRTFKNGQEQDVSPFFPKLTLVMGLEASVWKLKEVGLNLRLPLDDPKFLKAISESFARGSEAAVEMAPVSDVHLLILAEQRYKNAHPDRGYTCSLAELARMHFGSGTESTPILDAQLASGTKDNYQFAVGGCGSVPSPSFQVTATPLQGGHRAYCTDQSRTVRFSADGLAATCLASGQPVQGQSATGSGAAGAAGKRE